MKHMPEKTRRDFLRDCAIGALAAGAAPLAFARDVNPPSASQAKSKVIIARDAALYGSGNNPEAARVEKLLDHAMQAYSDSTDPVAPWRKLFKPNEVVGLKVNTIAGPGLSTHVALVEAICERLKQAGIRAGNIVVWDRTEGELERAGFTLSNDPMLAQRIAAALAGVEQVEMELRRKVDDTAAGGSVRSPGGEKVPQGYEDKVADYYRKLGKSK